MTVVPLDDPAPAAGPCALGGCGVLIHIGVDAVGALVALLRGAPFSARESGLLVGLCRLALGLRGALVGLGLLRPGARVLDLCILAMLARLDSAGLVLALARLAAPCY